MRRAREPGKRSRYTKSELNLLLQYYEKIDTDIRLKNIKKAIKYYEYHHNTPAEQIDKSTEDYIESDLSTSDIAYENHINISAMYDNIDLVLKIASEYK